MQLLLEKGIDTEAKDDTNRTPLSYAAKNGHEALVRLLLEKIVDIEAKDQEIGRRCWAVENGYRAAVQPLCCRCGHVAP